MSNNNLEIIIPEVNTENGLKLCDGEKTIYIQSLQIFVSNAPKVLEKIRAVSENNLQEYSIGVHGLKGICDYIGAEEARKTAKQLEDMSRNGDLAGVLAKNESFIKYTENIIGSLQAWLKKNNAVSS